MASAETGTPHVGQELPSDVFEANGLPSQTLDKIARRIDPTETSLIAIDGLPGAGKSTLASSLAERLRIRTVHLDDFIDPECTGFTDDLRYEDLRSALVQRPLIVEGVCMRDVLDRLSLSPTRFVYLQAPIADRHLDRTHPLVREVRAYTDRRHPVQRADLVLTRSECAHHNRETEAGRWSLADAFLMRHRSQISSGLTAAGAVGLAIGAVLIVAGSGTHRPTDAHLDGWNLDLVGAGILTILTSGISILLASAARAGSRAQRSTESRK